MHKSIRNLILVVLFDFAMLFVMCLVLGDTIPGKVYNSDVGSIYGVLKFFGWLIGIVSTLYLNIWAFEGLKD